MKPQRRNRLSLILLMVAGVSVAAWFGLRSFNENLMFFFSTSDVVEGKAPKDHLFRLGGMVVKGSVQRPGEGLTVKFMLTDMAKEVPVEYTGILPDLFREGQGIIANGKLSENGVFVAQEVLAKHDENYMPPEVAGSMKTAAGQVAGKAESSK
ncbi:MAG: cytochrome c maturation protein CcmE [Methylococcaceae bacterium]|nr:cytochrome c maturation protein CcmE [Methylococcaceae bacterium]MDZ4157170.1 cytochrome c maturation protein CcmE [Methylococcales bacterium]MDP2394870.1 cytochrome c maturation protein CcmE [Methylococcaceae bacterium]MDP3020291.1 cytochrome c maturation protein CcmE [Methylococcaceae bacterium]MDP3390832.1 cytochrome c maturation protein CcmE [Methylococcaceae bacterium]